MAAELGRKWLVCSLQAFGPRGVFALTPLDALGMCPRPPAVSVLGGCWDAQGVKIFVVCFPVSPHHTLIIDELVKVM